MSSVDPFFGLSSVEIFCSYSHQDEPLRREFDASVAVMRRNKQIQVWHDRLISAGDTWPDKIDEHLNTADIIVLFVSSDFLASNYCYEKELGRALERESKKEAVVIPIIVRDCHWSAARFSHLQGIPTGGKAVTSWSNRDEAWTAVAKDLWSTVQEVINRKAAEAKHWASVAEMISTGPNLEMPAADWAKHLEESQKAREIYAEIMRNAPLMQIRFERIQADMQSRIFRTLQDVTTNRARTDDKSFNNMDKYIRG